MPEGRAQPANPPDIPALSRQGEAAGDVTVISTTVAPDGMSMQITLNTPAGKLTTTARLSGPDAPLFTFIDRGEHSTVIFRTTPDFERPKDDGHDNQYDFNVMFDLPSNLPHHEFRIRVTDVTGDDDPTPPDGTIFPTAPIEMEENETVVSSMNQQALMEPLLDQGHMERSNEDDVKSEASEDGTAWRSIIKTPDGKIRIIEFRIAGVDGHLFAFAPFAFREAPSHETPRDHDRNNIYQFTLIRTDTEGETAIFPYTIEVTGGEEANQPDIV